MLITPNASKWITSVLVSATLSRCPELRRPFGLCWHRAANSSKSPVAGDVSLPLIEPGASQRGSHSKKGRSFDLDHFGWPLSATTPSTSAAGRVYALWLIRREAPVSAFSTKMKVSPSPLVRVHLPTPGFQPFDSNNSPSTSRLTAN